jgi:hypothetical protein
MTGEQMRESFPLHATVLPKSCPHGEPGTVIGFDRGKVLVCFADLNLTGRHSPERLVLHVAA